MGKNLWKIDRKLLEKHVEEVQKGILKLGHAATLFKKHVVVNF